MNKAEQLRAEIKVFEQSKEAINKIKETELLSEKNKRRIKDLPLDIALAYWLIEEHRRKILVGEYVDDKYKIVLNSSVIANMAYNPPDELRFHHLNNDNLDEVCNKLKTDGFKISNRKWVPYWESKDPDWPATGGEYYSVEVSW